MIRGKPIIFRSRLSGLACLAVGLLSALLAGCGVQIDHHGHVFMDVDLAQIQPGMSKDQVTLALGSPDTTSTIGGDTFYYISSTQKSYSFFKPWEIDRKVVAVYFNGQANVQQVAQYGVKDGIMSTTPRTRHPPAARTLACSSRFSATSPNGVCSRIRGRAPTPAFPTPCP